MREQKGLTQQQLAEASRVSQDAISNYETGRRDARFSTARKLAGALGVAVEDLADPDPVRPSPIARLTGAASVSAAQSALLFEVAMRSNRLRRQARRRPPEWALEEVERRLERATEPLERWALEGLGREFARERDRLRGKYRGDHLGYLREKISDEFFDFGWMEALLHVSDARLEDPDGRLADEDLDEMEEVLDETQARIDQLRETIDDYRRARRGGTDAAEGE